MRSLVLSCVVSLAVLRSGAAEAACLIRGVQPTDALPTMPSPQTFSFVATDDCAMLRFSAQDGAITHTPVPGDAVGIAGRRYSVQLTDAEWRAYAGSYGPTFTWTVSGNDAGEVTAVTTTNDFDVDRDGWTRRSGDAGRCDHLPNRNPAAEDVCDNGIDDDCDGVVDNCGLADPDTTILADGTMTQLGYSGTVAVGDVNGDGVADLQAGSIYAFPDARPPLGAVFLLEGPAPRGTIDARDLATITGVPHLIGWAVAAGDHDLDGVDDILASSADIDRAFLFLGPTTGSRAVQDADAVLAVGGLTHLIGGPVALLGDADGDAHPDVAFATPHVEPEARAYVVAGPLSGRVDLDTDATYTFTTTDARLGISLPRVGDLTGDGVDEIAIGDDVFSFTELEAIHFVEGGIAPGTYDPASMAWATLSPEERSSELAVCGLVAADYDGDGALDLLVGDSDANSSTGEYSGVVYGLLGPFSGGAFSTSSADVRWEATEDWIRLGTAVAAGDIDADGALDVVMGAPHANGNYGGAFVQRGSTTGTVDVGTLSAFTPPGYLDELGSSIVVVPDWTGDGAPEIAIGATRVNDYSGAVYVFESEHLF